MNKTNLSAYMAMTVSQLKEEQRMGTAHVYQSTLNRIKDLWSRTSISFVRGHPSVVESISRVSAGASASLEYNFHVYEDVACHLFPCRRRWAGSLSAGCSREYIREQR